MRKTLLFLFFVLALGLIVTPSYAVPMTLHLPGTPFTDVDVEATVAGIFTESATVKAVGHIILDVDYLFDPRSAPTNYVAIAQGIEFTGGTIALTNLSKSGSTLGISWSVQSNGIRGTFGSYDPPGAVTLHAESPSNQLIRDFDTEDHYVNLNQGTMSINSGLGDKTVNFASDPFMGSAPGTGVITTYVPTSTDGHNYTFDVAMRLPINVTKTGSSPVSYAINIQSNLVFNGSFDQFLNNAPVAGNNGTYRVHVGSTYNGSGLLINDSDADSVDTLTAYEYGNPTSGSATVNTNGSFSYTPTAIGTQTFRYRAYDGYDYSNPATVTFDSYNTRPVADNEGVYSVHISDVLSVGSSQGLLVGDYDLDDDAITAHKYTNPSSGIATVYSNGSFSYNPSSLGNDSFQYRAYDGYQYSDPATVSINVYNNRPVADNDGVYSVHISDVLNAGGSGSVLVGDYDLDDDAITAHKYTNPSSGSATVYSNGSFTYTPSELGNYPFQYRAYDGYEYSDPATVSINVYNNAANAVNDSNYELFQHGDLSVSEIIGVLQNDSDVDGDSFIATLRSDASHGDLVFHSDGSFEYTPYETFIGTDTFTYYADDQWGSPLDWAIVTIAVNEALAGDANLDGKVDTDDATIMVASWLRGTTGNPDAEWDMGDFNGDGKVDTDDSTLLVSNWLREVTSAGDVVPGSASEVPEPGTWILLLGALAGLALIRRKR